MRKRIKPIIVIVFFALFTSLILLTRTMAIQAEKRAAAIQEAQIEKEAKKIASESSTYVIENALEMKPIIDVSAWQRPEDIDYDTLSEQISGAIIRIQSGSHTKKENSATDKNGIDKSYKQHIEEFQKRGVPIAVYAYVTGNSIEAMKKEAQSFYKLSSPYKPTFYWMDVEEKTMGDMDAGVEAFRQELVDLGAKNIGLYIGTYFMDEHSISVDKFDALWIPTYGTDSGYYNAAPNTDLAYDLHQYTSRGYLNGFKYHLDLNLITSLKDPNEVYQKLFTVPE
ncbi:glycoside hydrolase family 25 protein [Streptococcus suis]|nr:glycoside hydrolase family 25 protein [Streptococcus suis]